MPSFYPLAFSLDDPADICCKITEHYSRQGKLRFLTVKERHDLFYPAPGAVHHSSTILHTLRVQRCGLPGITFPALKHLSMRQSVLLVSRLNLFPNLEELELLGTSVLSYHDGPFNGQRLSKSLRLKSLHIEQIGLQDVFHDFNRSAQIIVGFLRSSARHFGVEPFAHLQSLAVTLNSSPKLLELVEEIIKDSPTLREFVFQTSPNQTLAAPDLIAGIRNANHSLLLSCLPSIFVAQQDLQYADRSTSFLMDASLKLPGWYSVTHVLQQKIPSQTETDPVGEDAALVNSSSFMSLWTQVVSLFQCLMGPGRAWLKDVHLCIIDWSFKEICQRPKTPNEIEDIILGKDRKMGVITSVYLNNFRDPDTSRATIVFLLDVDSVSKPQ
ncbi:hypothetical protein CVT24_000199 [Panaeolus cyanescens]|uniref:Uncharacterized protein n=1 Tax=Panaeolus cyanescens TaxID=181874 RepID=A0A409W368_9AGAR|nr:hypothetical protein CVT24_000199 [Panaeolus cyanescens]